MKNYLYKQMIPFTEILKIIIDNEVIKWLWSIWFKLFSSIKVLTILYILQCNKYINHTKTFFFEKQTDCSHNSKSSLSTLFIILLRSVLFLFSIRWHLYLTSTKATIMNANKYFILSIKERDKIYDIVKNLHETNTSWLNRIESFQTNDVLISASNYLSCLHAL